MDHAILGRPLPPTVDYPRAQRLSLVIGCGIACVIAIGAVVSATLRPVVGDAALVLSRQSGALFVRVGDNLRPVANLSSAYLVLGHPAVPRLADDTALAGVPRGPVLGIPGAPQSLGAVVSSPDLGWWVCDDRAGTTTLTVSDTGEPPRRHGDDAALVSAPDGTTYLLYDGMRAPVDRDDPVVARALRLEGATPRRVSATLLNAVPEVPAISPPRIPGAGEPSALAGFPVGAVLRTAGAGSDDYYLVLRDGLQRVGRLTADLVRFADPESSTEIVSVAPGLVAANPMVEAPEVSTFPRDAPALLDIPGDLCATWRSDRVAIVTGDQGPAGPGVTLAGADGDGPNLDRVRVSPGRSIDVTAAMLTTQTGSSGRYLITDAGVRFPVRDSAAASALGLGPAPARAPWALIAALPAGPELGREAASVTRDVAVAPST